MKNRQTALASALVAAALAAGCADEPQQPPAPAPQAQQAPTQPAQQPPAPAQPPPTPPPPAPQQAQQPAAPPKPPPPVEVVESVQPIRVLSETTATGFTFPESVGCDAANRVLYVSQFGGTELKPAEKDGKGFISKVALDGKVIEARAFNVKLNKPKGIWIEGARLWVTDIDGVWIFDTATRKGRRIDLPGIEFANDPTVRDGALYVSDNRTDQLFRVEPADFLAPKVRPKVTVALKGRSVFPNGLFPARDGSLLMVGFQSPEQRRGIYALTKAGELRLLSPPIGRLDGLHEMRDGSLLVTDWNSGSLFRWSLKRGMETLAKDFKGPADLCVLGDTVYVPDLVKSEVRIIKLGH